MNNFRLINNARLLSNQFNINKIYFLWENLKIKNVNDTTTHPTLFRFYTSSHLNEENNVVTETLNELGPYILNQLDESNYQKRVFILQPRMQFKSKIRQSMDAKTQLEETISLVKTLGDWNIVKNVIISTKNASKKSIWRSGNIDFLSREISESGANILFIGIDKLTNMQIDSLRTQLLGNNPAIKIYDRYMVVLKIFKKHAKTTISKLQIALAEIPYIRYKYDNIELYRALEKKIKDEIEKQKQKRNLMNQNRRKNEIPIISVIGYTNVGKTLLIKKLTLDRKLEPIDKLFATLDVTYHGMKLVNTSIEVIFVDTIGLISDIPLDLIEAYKATLSDALNADLFIHVVDCSATNFEIQEQVVLKILKELQDFNQNMITVYNKYDKINDKNKFLLKCKKENILYISSVSGYGIDKLMSIIEEKIIKIKNYLELKLKIQLGSEEMKFLYKNCAIKNIETLKDNSQYAVINVLLDKRNARKFIRMFPTVQVLNKTEN